MWRTFKRITTISTKFTRLESSCRVRSVIKAANMIASEMTGNSNVTDIDLDWTDPYTLLDGLVWLKAIIGSFIGLKLTIGTYLMTAATLFERYSGDPRKRGLMNQVSREYFSCSWKSESKNYGQISLVGDTIIWIYCHLQLADIARAVLEDHHWSSFNIKSILGVVFHDKLLHIRDVPAWIRALNCQIHIRCHFEADASNKRWLFWTVSTTDKHVPVINVFACE